MLNFISKGRPGRHIVKFRMEKLLILKFKKIAHVRHISRWQPSRMASKYSGPNQKG